MRKLSMAGVLCVLFSLAGCAPPGEDAAAAAPAEHRYDVLITEPSMKISDSDDRLLPYWSCDPAADPGRRSNGGQDELWTLVRTEGALGQVRVSAVCPPGALLTVLADAVVDGSSVQLRCEVFDVDGDRVADEKITRGPGVSTAVCRVPVPA